MTTPATPPTDDADTIEARLSVYKDDTRLEAVYHALLGKDAKADAGSLRSPPISPDKLGALQELSSLLRPLVDAYATNIDAQGHRFEPAIDLYSPEADERVRDSMVVNALLRAPESGAPAHGDDVQDPSAEDIAAQIDSIRKTARLELARARAFFSTCTPDGTYTDLRIETRQDLEMTGNGYWEVLRNQGGTPTSLYRIPSITMRISKESSSLPVMSWRQITDIHWEPVRVRRSFRTFAQIDASTLQPKTWFKEFGDPRVVSRRSGKFYVDLTALRAAEGPDTPEATEVLHFEIRSIVSEYGTPRWIGNLPSVLGSRELDETNYEYFLSSAVPALALLVSGGKLGRGTRERLEEFFKKDVQGRRANHKLVVIEAERPRAGVNKASVHPNIDFVPLRSSQLKDALFLGYDQRNAKKVAASFRLPVSFLEGSPTLEELRLADEQVFQPQRDWFDAKINKFLMPALGIRFWQFCSNSSMTRNPEILGRLALDYGKAGFLLPAEVRKIGARVFREALRPIRQKWAAVPMPFTVAAFGLRASPAEAVREQGRQQGDPAPLDDLLSQLGLGSEEASVVSVRGPEDDLPGQVDDEPDDFEPAAGTRNARLPRSSGRSAQQQQTEDGDE